MKYKLDKSSHSICARQYHPVQCVKYRRKVLDNQQIIDFLGTKVYEISQTFKVEVLKIECDKDHSHMLFKSKPTLDIPKYLDTVEAITSREIKRNFPEVKKQLWKEGFWPRSHFLATTG